MTKQLKLLFTAIIYNKPTNLLHYFLLMMDSLISKSNIVELIKRFLKLTTTNTVYRFNSVCGPYEKVTSESKKNHPDEVS